MFVYFLLAFAGLIIVAMNIGSTMRLANTGKLDVLVNDAFGLQAPDTSEYNVFRPAFVKGFEPYTKERAFAIVVKKGIMIAAGTGFFFWCGTKLEHERHRENR